MLLPIIAEDKGLLKKQQRPHKEQEQAAVEKYKIFVAVQEILHAQFMRP